MKLNFEIVISKFQNRYKAFCPAFPECMGEGDNEEEAMEDLGNAITLHLGDTVRKTLDDVKHLGLLRRLPELDLEQKKQAANKGLPYGDLNIKEGKLTFSGKLPINKDWLRIIDKKASSAKIKKILGIGTVPGLGQIPILPPLFEELQSPYNTELQEEGLLFGVPLSLN
ncbi:MAG: type II toxin-antitoxin system HicB family antitoxin [Candidatus Margulisbacteria bacterium]|nr:type II toxin-antitoxin system HicB family antitoxin [Candidatus Margulisiibacteriota bacterium]